MRSPQEKNTRLENMTWRIWNVARKKKEVRLFALGSFLFSPSAVLLLMFLTACAHLGFDNSIRKLGSGKGRRGLDYRSV